MPGLENLRRVRERKAKSQEELALASGVARSTIIRLERGQSESNFQTMRKLAAALDVEPEELMGDARS